MAKGKRVEMVAWFGMDSDYVGEMYPREVAFKRHDLEGKYKTIVRLVPADPDKERELRELRKEHRAALRFIEDAMYQPSKASSVFVASVRAVEKSLKRGKK